MYRLLLVDDEDHVRQAVTALGDWAGLGIAVVGEAANGQRAMEFLASRSVDIVITDIKMPLMDGIELIKRVGEQYPQVKCILLSGFGEFEYAKQAINYHVVSYLLKPVVREDLNNALQTACDRLENERRIAKTAPVASLIQQMRAGNGFFGIALLHLVREKAGRVRPYAVVRAVQLSLGSAARLIDCGDNNILISITEEAPSGQEAKQKGITALRTLVKSLHNNHDIIAIAAISDFDENPAVLVGCYDELQEMVYNTNLLQDSYEVCASAADTHDSYRGPVTDKKDMFLRALKNHNAFLAHELVKKYFDQLVESGFLSANELRTAVADFMLVFRELAAELRIEGAKSVLAANSLPQSVTEASSAVKYLCDAFDRLAWLYEPNDRASADGAISEIKEYIDNNYFVDINLTTFSDRYFLTKEYLSKRFKEAYGFGIYEYVLRYRMEKASELLSSSDAKIRDISEAVGYPDTNYFSRAFKGYFGISPKEYRAKL